MNPKLKKIRQENARLEKTSTFNYCDRWCERCPFERQSRCKLYQDELERKITAIAHGRDPDDSEITEEVMRWQYALAEEKLEESMEEMEEEEIDLDESDDPAIQKIKEHIAFVENNPLEKTVRQYSYIAHDFLEKTFFTSENLSPELKYDFETIAWYHTLLPAKLHRALCGFHEPMVEGDFALYDAVAQFDICLEGIEKSVVALKRLKIQYPQNEKLIIELLALLHNLSSRIAAMEENI